MQITQQRWEWESLSKHLLIWQVGKLQELNIWFTSFLEYEA